MAWNGSIGSQAAPNRPEPKAPSKLRGLVALAAIVILGGLAAWFFLSPSEKPAAKWPAKSSSKIADVAPAVTYTNAQSVSVVRAKTQPKELPPQKVGEIRDGYRLLGNGKLHKVSGVITNSLAHRKAATSIFNHRSENILAAILAHRPGDIMVGNPNYNGTFTKDFFDSLQDPIVIDPDDTDEHKELKKLVIEAKKTLKEAMDRGEDVEKIVMDARKECQELARYKQVLTKEVFDYVRKDEVTDQDVELYIQAANKMLEEKGIAPMNAGPLTRLKLKMQNGGIK